MGIFSRTWYGSGVGQAYIYQSVWGFKSAERTRQDIHALAAVRKEKHLVIGGARADRHANTSAAAFDHPNYWDVPIDWTDFTAGFTVVARVEVVTSSASCSITPRIRNVTDSTDINGTSSIGTTYVEQVITIPVPGTVGLKRYRLQLVPGLASIGVNAVGVIEIYG